MTTQTAQPLMTVSILKEERVEIGVGWCRMELKGNRYVGTLHGHAEGLPVLFHVPYLPFLGNHFSHTALVENPDQRLCFESYFDGRDNTVFVFV